MATNHPAPVNASMNWYLTAEEPLAAGKAALCFGRFIREAGLEEEWKDVCKMICENRSQ